MDIQNVFLEDQGEIGGNIFVFESGWILLENNQQATW